MREAAAAVQCVKCENRVWCGSKKEQRHAEREENNVRYREREKERVRV